MSVPLTAAIVVCLIGFALILTALPRASPLLMSAGAAAVVAGAATAIVWVIGYRRR